MHVSVIGAGLMGSAICYDLLHHTSTENVTLVDKDKKNLDFAESLCDSSSLVLNQVDIHNQKEMKNICKKSDIFISAVPYFFNELLTTMAIDCNTHFIDLGGNNDVVFKQKMLHDAAIQNGVTIIPDLGLAPGLVSIITRDIVDCYDDIEYVKLRVGGLPVHPKPPLKYEIVFSPNGLINEYLEKAIVLDHGDIIYKPSLTEIESLFFPPPFENMEAFITSGGCSTLPHTYKNQIKYLDYKTIRYPGHCDKIKTLFDLGFGLLTPIKIDNQSIIPRDVLIHQLNTVLPKTGDDVVLLKVISQAKKDGEYTNVEYTMIDYKDKKNSLSAMMRTTGFPVSITADFIGKNIIKTPGVYGPEEIIPPRLMFQELKKRQVVINKTEKKIQ